MSVQTLDTDGARATLADVATVIDMGICPPGMTGDMRAALEMLPADERRRWERKYRVPLRKAIYQTRSRSTAHYAATLDRAAGPLHDAGLVDDDYRDRETGRKVKSLIGELARLHWVSDDALVGSYHNLRDEPLDVVKKVIRQHNQRVQTLDAS
jgi:hypothetical protein